MILRECDLRLRNYSDIVHQSFSDFSYLMPGYVGRKFALQGDIDPFVTGEAILELSVAHLRSVFIKRNGPMIENLREIAKRYEGFVFEGTELNRSEGETDNAETPETIENEASANVEFQATTREVSEN